MRTRIVKISELKAVEISRMYELMNRYYANVDEPSFLRDLREKQKVILMFSRDSVLQGFSTILEVTKTIQGKKFIALYSGDTVLEREHWGCGVLPMAFGRYLMFAKLRNPFTPVNWFLISKGYKTYLLMTNNFPTHYPRLKTSTPQVYLERMDAFYGERFGRQYDSKQGLIFLGSDAKAQSVHIKAHVADISAENRLNPKIRFFEDKNPRWYEGVELACIAEVTLWIPLRYVLKRIVKGLRFNDRKFKTVSRS
jgi:hypothetical protein